MPAESPRGICGGTTVHGGPHLLSILFDGNVSLTEQNITSEMYNQCYVLHLREQRIYSHATGQGRIKLHALWQQTYRYFNAVHWVGSRIGTRASNPSRCTIELTTYMHVLKANLDADFVDRTSKA